MNGQSRQVRRTVNNQDNGKKNSSMILTSGLSPKNLHSKSSANLKRDESREKKPRGTAKSHVNINVDELVKNNAQKMLEELKREREKEEILKKAEQEKQQKLKLDSRRIRINNLRQFGLPNQQKAQKNYPWGVDQRRLMTSPKSLSQERPSREKSQIMRRLTEDERRSNLGLDKFNNDILDKLIQKQREANQSHDHELHGEKHSRCERGSSPNDQIRDQDIKNFIRNKRKKIVAEQMLSKLVKKDSEKRIQENLEKLNHEARERLSLSRSPKQTKKKKKKLNSSADFFARKSANQASRQNINLPHYFGRMNGRKSSSSPECEQEEGAPSSQHSFNLNAAEEDNYSFLYNEFRQILSSKHRNHGSYMDHNASSTSISGDHAMSHAVDKRELLQKRYEDLASHFENIKNANERHHQVDEKTKKLHNTSSTSQGNLKRKDQQFNLQGSKGHHQEIYGSDLEIYSQSKKDRSRDLKVNEILGAMSYKSSHGEERAVSHIRDQQEEEYDYGHRETEEYAEVMEAAAVFIQKNFRGYLTRKLLRDYFEKLCSDNQSDSQMEYARKQERYEESDLRSDSLVEDHSSQSYKESGQSKPAYNHREHIYEAENQDSYVHHEEAEGGSQLSGIEGGAQDPERHAHLIEKILAQARLQQEKEDNYGVGHAMEANYKAAIAEAQNYRYGETGSGYEDSDPDCYIDPQTLSLLELIERQKDQMQAAKKRFLEEDAAEKELLQRYAKKPKDDMKDQRKSTSNEISSASSKRAREDQNTVPNESGALEHSRQEGKNKVANGEHGKKPRVHANEKLAVENRNKKVNEQPRAALQQVLSNNVKKEFQFQKQQQLKGSQNMESIGRNSTSFNQESGHSNLNAYSDENRGFVRSTTTDGGKKGQLGSSKENQSYQSESPEESKRRRNPPAGYLQGAEDTEKAVLQPMKEGQFIGFMLNDPARMLEEKKIIISALESERSHEGILGEDVSDQVKHYNSLDRQFSTTSNIMNEISPIGKIIQNSPAYEGSSGKKERKYQGKISQQQKASVISYGIENEEYSAYSISKRAKSKSNPESLRETQCAIKDLFGSPSQNANDQKFEFEYQHRRQKSESDLMRDNLIEELKRMEQFTPQELSVQQNTYENEGLTQQGKNTEPLEKSKAAEAKKEDYSSRGPLTFEESTDKMEEGMKQWLEGNLTNLESDHEEEESKQLESKKQTQDSQPKKEINAPKTTPNEKASANQQAKEGVNKGNEVQDIKWDEIINQIALLRQTEGGSMTSTAALNMIDLLQQKLEANRKLLEKSVNIDPSAQKISSSVKQPPNTEVFPSPMLVLSPRDKSKKLNPVSPRIQPKNLLEKFDSLNAGELKSPTNREKLVESKDKKSAGLPWKKGKNLMIDTEMIESEASPTHFKNGPTSTLTEERSLQGILLDLSQMRRTLGSEQLVKEKLNSPGLESLTDGNEGDIESPTTEEKVSISIFDQDPFKLFTERKLKELLKQDNMEKVIKMREQVLDYRHKSQIDKLNRELQNNRVSPRTFQNKRSEIEKWITQEKEQIQISKHALEKGMSYYNDTLKRTQRDLLFMQRLASPKEEHKISIADFNMQSSFSDDDAHQKSTQGAKKEGAMMPELDSEVLIFSGRDKFSRRKTLSPNGSKNIKIVDDLELDDYLTREKPNKKTDTSSDTLFSPRRDNFEDSIKEQAEHSARFKESPRLGSPKDSFQKIIASQAGKQTKPDKITFEIAQAEASEAAALKKGENEQAPHNSHENLEEVERKEDYERQYENFLKVLADFNNSKPLKEGLDDDLGSPHSKGYLSSLRDEPAPRDTNAPVPGESIFETQFIKEAPEETLKKNENLPGNQGNEAEIHNIVSRTLDWCIQQIEREENLRHEFVRPENPGIDPEIIEKHNKAAIHVKNFIETQETSKQSSSAQNNSVKQENQIIKMEKIESLEPSPIQNEIGIPTSIAAVKDYLDFLGELIKTHFRQEFLTNINIPTSLSPEEKLAALHGYDMSLLEGQPSIAQIQDAQAVLSIKIYLTAEEKIRELLPDRTDFISDLEIIHNKALFDCLNEALDYYRPYSIYGAPYPWKPSPAAIARKVADGDIDDVLEKSKEKVILWASFRAGYMGSGALLESDSAEKKEEILTQIKEERLSKALAYEVYEREEEWINYDDQRTELEIEIADLLFERLTLETAELLYNFSQKKNPETQI